MVGPAAALACSSSKIAASASPASSENSAVAPPRPPATARSAASAPRPDPRERRPSSISTRAARAAAAPLDTFGEIVARRPTSARQAARRFGYVAPLLLRLGTMLGKTQIQGVPKRGETRLQPRTAQHRTLQTSRGAARVSGAAARRRRADASAARAAFPRAHRSSAVSATRRARIPGGVRPSGRPAELSTSIPQRSSSTATRRARPRSGVTSAATLPGVSTRLAQEHGNGERLLALVRRLDECRCRRPPRAFRRPRRCERSLQRSACSPAASLRIRNDRGDAVAFGAAAKRYDRVARHAHPSRAAASSRTADDRRRPARARSTPIASQASVIKILVEAGKHDGAVLQPRDRRKQRRRRRNRAGRPGGDDRSRRALRESRSASRRISRSRRAPGSIRPRSREICSARTPSRSSGTRA